LSRKTAAATQRTFREREEIERGTPHTFNSARRRIGRFRKCWGYLPQTRVDLGDKVLYKHKNMTVEFHNGKLTDVR
jgi:hypothetical protein